MVQPRIDEYFKSARSARVAGTKGTSFLNLPYAIRHRVYMYAGLRSKAAIYLNYQSDGNQPEEYDGLDPTRWPAKETAVNPQSQSLSHFLDGPLPYPEILLDRWCALCSPGDCDCSILPYQLLYVSKLIASEVSSIFFSENYFSVYRNGLGGLSCLRNLPRGAISRMKSLTVCLGICNWEHSTDCDGCLDCWNDTIKTRNKSYSTAKNRKDINFLEEWQQLLYFVASQVRPNELSFTLICDAADPESAKEVAVPILQLPLLKACTVRLGSFSDRTEAIIQAPIQRLARQIAEEVTGSSKEPKLRSCWADLPTEIQLQILECTELITPFDLTWLCELPNKVTRNFLSGNFVENRALLNACCGDCSDVLEASWTCSCWTCHSAFSTSCTCWKLPRSIFLTSRGMKEKAEFLFFSKNHFVIRNGYHSYHGHEALFSFLTHIPENGRRYLQSISWMLPSIRESFLTPRRPLFIQWQAAIEILSRKQNLSNFSLTIDTCFDTQHRDGHESLYEFREAALRTWDACNLIAGVLSPLGKFKRLFFHLQWPTELYDMDITRDRGSVLEKRLMGKDYDSAASGKSKNRHEWNGYECWPCKECHG